MVCLLFTEKNIYMIKKWISEIPSPTTVTDKILTVLAVIGLLIVAVIIAGYTFKFLNL